MAEITVVSIYHCTIRLLGTLRPSSCTRHRFSQLLPKRPIDRLSLMQKLRLDWVPSEALSGRPIK